MVSREKTHTPRIKASRRISRTLTEPSALGYWAPPPRFLNVEQEARRGSRAVRLGADLPSVFTIGTCTQPYVKGLVTMVNSIYNGYRMEDVWLDK